MSDMFRSFSKKSIVASLLIAALGLLIISGMFVYYGFNLGIQPCEGLPSDAANCGDADLGGVVFVFVGLPIALFGIVSLAVAWILDVFKPGYNRGRFLLVLYVLLAVLVAGLLAALFV